MKVGDNPGLHDAVSGQLVSNKRVQQWEQEFLSQQRRLGPKGEAPRSRAGDQSFASPQKGANGSSALRGQLSDQTGSTSGARIGGMAVSGPKISGQRVAAIYNRLSGQGQGPTPGSNRPQVESTNRPDVRPGARLAEVRALLGRLKGHLVVEREGVVSIWLGRKLRGEEKARTINSIKRLLAHCGFIMGRLTINGIEEEI